jgi:cellulose synthase/poly-beta-1,6-N-acetylglucosamine synthase-like glycosyltransferase
MFEMIFFIVICGYYIQSVLFVIGASRKFPTMEEQDLPTVSVIVAARNEEKHILRCLRSLEKLIYPEGKLEIILVDDQSTDGTGKIIDEFIAGKRLFRKIISQKEIGRLKGKTNALANGLAEARNEVIFTTDADCEVKPTWIKRGASYYFKNVGMVNGITTQSAFDVFSGMQSLDFVYLLIVAASTINLRSPISCIGNNMSYRKAAYDEVGGYEKLPFSVTEDFNLMMAIYKLNKYKIIFPVDKETLVTSLPCPDLKSLFHQKKRWAVGGLGVPFRGFVIMANGFLTYLGILLTPFFYTPLCLYLIVLKVIVDIFVIYPVLKMLGIKENFRYFISFQFYYLIYVLALPFMVLASRKVTWKGRKY